MGYGNKSLNDLRDEATRIANEHGFTDATFVEQIALIHSEVSEALEDFRKGFAPAKMAYRNKAGEVVVSFWSEGQPPNKPIGIPSELADILIRVFHLAGQFGIDLDQAVRCKMIYNETREFKHGKII